MDYRGEIVRIIEDNGAPMTIDEINNTVKQIIRATANRMINEGRLYVPGTTPTGRRYYDVIIDASDYGGKGYVTPMQQRIIDVLRTNGGEMDAPALKAELGIATSDLIQGDLQVLRQLGYIQYNSITHKWTARRADR